MFSTDCVVYPSKVAINGNCWWPSSEDLNELMRELTDVRNLRRLVMVRESPQGFHGKLGKETCRTQMQEARDMLPDVTVDCTLCSKVPMAGSQCRPAPAARPIDRRVSGPRYGRAQGKKQS